MIKKIKNAEFIRKYIYDDKELFSRISDDYTQSLIPNRERYDPLKASWIGYFKGDICKGLMSIDPETSITLNIHINIPEKYRGKGAFKIGNSLMKWVENNCNKRYIKLNAVIPSCHKDVLYFAKKNGFQIYGKDKRSHLKNGTLHDRFFLSKEIVRIK